MDESRRAFLKKAGYAGLGVGCGFPLLSAACNALNQDASGAGSSAHQLAMVIDVQKCLREDVRRACIAACNEAHSVSDDANAEMPERRLEWLRTETFEHAFPDEVHGHIAEQLKGKPVLALCNHCTSPACVKVCPTGATWKRRSDGIVMMDMHRCIGCRYCVVACPYGARRFNWRDPRPYLKGKTRSEYPTREKGVVEKCTFCAEVLRSGGPDAKPACVVAANRVQEGALAFGNLRDPKSDVSRVLRERRTICRRIGLGTGPNVYYIV